VAGDAPLLCAAFDGPLRSGFEPIGRYRSAERMLTRRLARRIGKPGASSAPVGRLLNAHANACATAVLAHCDVAAARHTVRIDERAVVEAFPSGFLGLMIDDPASVGARRHDRSDRFFLRCSEQGTFARLIDRLLPGRALADPAALTDHDERAAFVCALTALCVAADDYTAVGDGDGWIILPPYALLAPWATLDLETNAAAEGGATLFRSQRFATAPLRSPGRARGDGWS
jgi:hypothetical protein